MTPVSLRARLTALRHDYARAEGLRNECERLGLSDTLNVLNVYGQIVAHLDELLALETPEPTCGTCAKWSGSVQDGHGRCADGVRSPRLAEFTDFRFGCNQWAARATAEQEAPDADQD